MRPKDWLTAEEAKRRLNYDPATGKLTWKSLRNSKRVGEEAKCLDASGYIQINVAGTLVKGHRLAWLLHFGVWPSGQIDHINGVRNDNRIANLRCVNNQINCQNQRNGVRPNRTGLLGVSIRSNGPAETMYRAKIQINGRQVHLGGHATPEAAHAAYVSAKRQLHAGGVL